MIGFRTALSWLTIFPVKAPDDVNRHVGARVVKATPLVGVVPVSYTHLTLPTKA